jgi:putative DNA primase/helicase
LDAKCPLWEKALLEIFSGNADLVAYLRRLLGYSLIGSVLLAIFVVLVGRGRNGKSLIVFILSKIMGASAGVIRPEMLLENSGARNPAGPTPEIMTLRGLRAAFASETDDGCKISPSRVKWLTGNDTLTGRNPHDKYEVQFPPTHTLFLLTNHKPHAPADDFAFWERMRVIPFEVSFVDRPPKADYERQADPNLPEKLEQELPAILAWMVRGCLEFQQIGLDPPPAVKQAVQEYQREEDLLADFLEGYCIIGSQYSVEFSKIYPVFETWWGDNVGTRVPSRIKFAKLLTKKGFEKTRGRTSRYYGLALLAEDGIF